MSAPNVALGPDLVRGEVRRPEGKRKRNAARVTRAGPAPLPLENARDSSDLTANLVRYRVSGRCVMVCVSCGSWADLGIEHDRGDCDDPTCPCQHAAPGTFRAVAA